jgi:hypothetical protein
MSPIEHPHHARSARLHRKLALPAIGLALAAALHAQAATVPDTPRQDNAYALVSAADKGMSVTGDGTDWKSLAQVRRSVGGDFLWFRDGGKSWYVQDPAVLAKVRAAWEPVNRLGEQMNEYGKEMTRQGQAMDALGKNMSQAAAGVSPDQERMADIGHRMDDAGKPMDALGKKMDGLGKRMQAESAATDKTVRALIRDAMARGLARPAPQG